MFHELATHLGFLKGNVDLIGGGEYGQRRYEHWPGANPDGDTYGEDDQSQAANCRRDLNCLASATVATIALAVIGPMPGIVDDADYFIERCQAIN